MAINCGQGYECGWSSGSATPTPNDFVTDCLALGNSIGARFGDNYTPAEGFTDYGFLRVTNSILLNNIRDVWGYNWQDWTYRSSAMDIQSNYLTIPNGHHPNNRVWDPARDGWRLAAFMSTAPDAPVGIALAVWTNEFAMASIFDGVPIGLSCFTTNFVAVDYTFQDATGGALAAGTMIFAPGETVKRVYPAGFDLTTNIIVRVVLSNPARGELTGATSVTFQGSVPGPQVRCWVSGVQADPARVIESVPVMLTAKSALAVSVDYEFESDAGPMASGTLTFPPGQTLAWAVAPGIVPGDHTVIRLKLGNPTAAALGAPSIVYFIPTYTPVVPAPTTLIAKGSVWKYLDIGTNAGVAWRNPGYDDTAWNSGRAELGYGDGDEVTTVRYGPDANNKYITTYFRHAFTVPDPLAFTDVGLWLKRDDGGVVYLNGVEVFRSTNMPAPPAVISYNTLALGNAAENAIDTATVAANRLVTGANLAAVEIHQQALNSSDISFDFELLGHPIPPPPPPQPVYIAQFDGDLAILWSDPTLVLQHAEQISGPWNTVLAPSPVIFDPNPATPQQFYRLTKP